MMPEISRKPIIYYTHLKILKTFEALLIPNFSYITIAVEMFWSHFSPLINGFCTIFCKFDHCVGSTRGKATRATCTVVSFAKKSAKTT